jgi:dipeptidyl aminopeptidase/acylaminoacyl peptidase
MDRLPHEISPLFPSVLRPSRELARLAIHLVLVIGAVAACRERASESEGALTDAREACARKILYASSHPSGKPYDHSDVVVLDTGSRQAARLSFERYIALGSGRAWSPDGRRIAVLSAGEKDVAILVEHGLEMRGADHFPPQGMPYVMNGDGSDLRRLIDLPALEYDWSPEGSQLVFQSVHQDATLPGKPEPSISTVLYIVDVDGGALVRITPISGYEGEPQWSPDGRRIAYVTDLPAGLKPVDVARVHEPQRVLEPATEIHVIDLETRMDERVTDDPAGEEEPLWSPDGERLAFTRLRRERSRQRVRTEVWVVDVPGGTPRILLDKGGWGLAGWSHDGRWLYAWKGRSPQDEPGVIAVDVETGDVDRVRATEDLEGLLLKVRLDRDGRRLVLLEGEDDGGHRLLELHLEGEAPVELASIPHDARYVDWTDCAPR